ncbi:MAG: hypothetical protein AAF747_08770 [Planctomycetota bacterium]
MAPTPDAVRIAGELAERGVIELVLVKADSSRETLMARATDLPAVLDSLGADDCIEAHSLGLEVVRDDDELVLRPR